MIIDPQIRRYSPITSGQAPKAKPIAEAIYKALSPDADDTCLAIGLVNCRNYAGEVSDSITGAFGQHVGQPEESHFTGQQWRISWRDALADELKRLGHRHHKTTAECCWLVGYHLDITPKEHGLPSAVEHAVDLADQNPGFLRLEHLLQIARNVRQEPWQFDPTNHAPDVFQLALTPEMISANNTHAMAWLDAACDGKWSPRKTALSMRGPNRFPRLE